MIEAAQEAADAGDYPAAERLLREAAAIQEATPRLAASRPREHAEQPRLRLRAHQQHRRSRARLPAGPCHCGRLSRPATSVRRHQHQEPRGTSARRTGFRSGSRRPFEPDNETSTARYRDRSAARADDAGIQSTDRTQVASSIAWRTPLAIGVDRPRDRLVAAVVVHDRARARSIAVANDSPRHRRRHPHLHSKSSRQSAVTPESAEPTPARVERPGTPPEIERHLSR